LIGGYSFPLHAAPQTYAPAASISSAMFLTILLLFSTRSLNGASPKSIRWRHTSGSIAVLDVQNRVLISGDPIQEHGRVFMFGEHRNMEDYIASLEHLESFADQFDEIWPSHADIHVSPAVIRKLRDGAQAVLDGAVQGKPAELFGQSIVVYDLGFCTLLCGQ